MRAQRAAEYAPLQHAQLGPRHADVAAPLFRLVSDHLHRLQTVYDDRFAREYGPWRPVVALVADRFLTRVLVHIADKGRVATRYSGWYANRPCGMRVKAKPAVADAPLACPTCHPTVPAAHLALTAHERVGGHAAARHPALARSTIAPYSRRIVDPLRLTFLSRAAAYARGTGHQQRRARVGSPEVAGIRDAR